MENVTFTTEERDMLLTLLNQITVKPVDPEAQAVCARVQECVRKITVLTAQPSKEHKRDS